jgi:branched-chain amino acid transport system ATP-binding protein
MTTDRLLCLHGMSTGYFGTSVVRDVDLEVGRGEVVALLGANGAGKTSTLLAVSGINPILGGDIELFGSSVRRRPAHQLAREGLAHVPEDRALFQRLTVEENLRLGLPRRTRDLDEALEYFPHLQPLLARQAGLLSGGEQQSLAIARALASGPRMLIIDELSLGLAPIIVEQILRVLRVYVDDHGAGLLLVEQHVDLALGSADRAYVMSRGRLVASGAADELRADRRALEASYIGRSRKPDPA